MVLVTYNSSQFAADVFSTWLNGVGCRHPFTAQRQSCSNIQAENFIRTLKLLLVPLLLQHVMNWREEKTHFYCNVEILDILQRKRLHQSY